MPRTDVYAWKHWHITIGKVGRGLAEAPFHILQQIKPVMSWEAGHNRDV